MNTRRQFLATLAASALAFAAAPVLAAPPVVEIVAMGHPPVKAALQPLREWLAAQGSKVRVTEIDIEGAEGAKRLQAAGLTGHIPVLILVDGKHAFRRKDGSQVAFVNFPNTPDTPPGARGNWTTADVQAVIAERIKGK